MSRNVRDLRDLICVSRLTVRESDDEMFSSDEDSTPPFARKLSKSSLETSSSNKPASDIRRNSTASPDSGFGTNNQSPQEGATEVGISPSSSFTGIVPKPPLKAPQSDPRVARARKKKKTKSKSAASLKAGIVGTHELPKPPPLPPVASRANGAVAGSAGDVNRGSNERSDTNFDSMLTFIDANLLSEWLQESNRTVSIMASFCHAGANFVHFAHFWLSEFPEAKKHEIFKLEYSIIQENLQFAFALGRESGSVTRRDTLKFAEAVFREYPSRLLSMKGPYMFLDYLDVLSSERQESYKRVLSDVKCSTRVKAHAQWTLGFRAHALVSVWYAVLGFYRRLMRDSGGDRLLADPVALSTISKKEPYELRMYQAIRNGYADVVLYLIKSGLVKATIKSHDDKGLLFTAVQHNQPKVLKCLLNFVRPKLDVNQTSNTGNTPLHAAANNGNVEVTAMLLEQEDIRVNAVNVQCEDATALHAAVMHGHVGVTELLLKAGADASMRMNDMTPWDIAKEFGHFTICNLLTDHKEALVAKATKRSEDS